MLIALTIILALAGLHILRRIQQRDATARASERQAQLDAEAQATVQRWRDLGLA